MMKYEATLRSMTQGRASFTMEFSHMETVPPQIQEKIIKESGFVATGSPRTPATAIGIALR